MSNLNQEWELPLLLKFLQIFNNSVFLKSVLLVNTTINSKKSKMKPKLLIIEDNPQNMYLMTYLFENSKYEVFQAYSGNDGLSLAEELTPEVILLDIELPEMDGYKVAEEIRGRNKLKHIPIIVVTSFAMAGEREKSYEAGASGYIEKPINPDTFLDQVEHFLNFGKT